MIYPMKGSSAPEHRRATSTTLDVYDHLVGGKAEQMKLLLREDFKNADFNDPAVQQEFEKRLSELEKVLGEADFVLKVEKQAFPEGGGLHKPYLDVLDRLADLQAKK